MEKFEAFLNEDLPTFQTWDGKKKIHNLGEYIREFIKKADVEHIIYIGTDSQIGEGENHSTYCYTTVVLLRRPNRGGHALYHHEFWDAKKLDFRSRLLKEAHMSLEIGEYLEDELVGVYKRIESGKKLADIDIDFNPHPGDKDRNKSNLVYKEAVGWLTGCGYRVRTKPFAVVAKCVADRMAKRKARGGKRGGKRFYRSKKRR